MSGGKCCGEKAHRTQPNIQARKYHHFTHLGKGFLLHNSTTAKTDGLPRYLKLLNIHGLPHVRNWGCFMGEHYDTWD